VRTVLVCCLFIVGCTDPVHINPRDPRTPGFKPLEPTFKSLRENLIEPKCIECHSAGGEAELTPLATREDLVDSPLEIVIPGNPDDSALMIVLRPGARKPMPPPDSGVAPVSEEDLKVIEEWIRSGAR
jgi:uncharacterized membrane protein